MAAFNINSEPIKWAVIAISSPVWLPFIKALIQEFNDSLRDEGGLFGTAPSKQQLAEMDRELGKFRTPLISERHEDAERKRGVTRGGRATRGARRGFGPRAG